MSISIFDAHFHIIDPKFPLVQNQGYLPDFYTVKDYIEEVQDWNFFGGAVVSASFQGFDQTYLKNALYELGSHYVGVTQLPKKTSDKDLQLLNQLGVRGVRFNCKRGGSENIKFIKEFALRIYDLLSWHVELYIDAKDLKYHIEELKELPSLSIAHLGLSKEGFKDLIFLVERGAKVKACGFSRLNFSPIEKIRELLKVNPFSVMFGSDLPSTRAPERFSLKDLKMMEDNFSFKELQLILYQNALRFYQIEYCTS